MLSTKNKKIVPDAGFSFVSPLTDIITHPEKWDTYIRSNHIGAILVNLSVQVKWIDFFKWNGKTTQIFDFLKEFIRSKPVNTTALKSFNKVFFVIHRKIVSQSLISEEQIGRIQDYLQLLETILQPQHRYLLDSNEITIQAKLLEELSSFLMKKVRPIPLHLLDYVVHDILLQSFHCLRFLNAYPRLIKAIYFLAQGVEKNATVTDLTSYGVRKNTSITAVTSSKLFNSLGALLYQLRYQAKKLDVSYHLPAAVVDFEHAKNRLCNLFKQSVDKNLLGAIVYNLFLYPAYKDEPDYLRAHQEYAAQCNSARRRFSKRYICKKTAKLPSLAITIEHRNVSKTNLTEACRTMRRVEVFIDWLQGLELGPIKKAPYLLRIAESKPDFFLDMFYFERDRSVFQDTYVTLAIYYPEARQRYRRAIQGVTYTYFTYLTYPFVVAHEYIHHLYFFLMGKNMYIDPTSTEGIAELFAGGVCHPNYVKQLKLFARDSSPLKTLYKIDVLPETFYAFKWVSYLINRHITFFMRLLMLLKKGEKDRFYSKAGRFLNNSIHVQDFLSWSVLQADVCGAYSERYPGFSERPIVYLRHIIQRLASDLEYKPVAIRKSRSALAIAEEISRFIRNTSSFTQVTTNTQLSLNGNNPPERPYLNSTELAVYKPRIPPLIEIVIPFPLSAFFCGVLSAGLDHIGEINKEAYFYLPRLMTYGFKPILFAFISAGVNSLIAGPIETFESRVLSFSVYFAINYSSLLTGQAIYQKVSEKVRNKWLVFFIQTFTWMCLWNPSLLTSEAFFSDMLSSVLLSLIQGLCFVLGERGAYAMMIPIPFRNHPKETLPQPSKRTRFRSDFIKGIVGTEEASREAFLEMDSFPLSNSRRIYIQTNQSNIAFWQRSGTTRLSSEDEGEDLSIKSCSNDVRLLSSSV